MTSTHSLRTRGGKRGNQTRHASITDEHCENAPHTPWGVHQIYHEGQEPGDFKTLEIIIIQSEPKRLRKSPSLTKYKVTLQFPNRILARGTKIKHEDCSRVYCIENEERRQ